MYVLIYHGATKIMKKKPSNPGPFCKLHIQGERQFDPFINLLWIAFAKINIFNNNVSLLHGYDDVTAVLVN
jgi:hypothetical protein